MPEYGVRKSGEPAPKLSVYCIYTVFMPLKRDRGKILEESLQLICHTRDLNNRESAISLIQNQFKYPSIFNSINRSC